jgi:hypothetical protein
MPTAQQLMKATLVAAVILVPAAARAVSNDYDASKCHGVTHRDEQYLVRYAGTLQYWPSGTSYPDSVDVVCPITKTTSGPGITNDWLSVKASGYTSWATCTLSEYQSTINVNSNVLWVVGQFDRAGLRHDGGGRGNGLEEPDLSRRGPMLDYLGDLVFGAHAVLCVGLSGTDITDQDVALRE